jgi:hypothetical protein
MVIPRARRGHETNEDDRGYCDANWIPYEPQQAKWYDDITEQVLGEDISNYADYLIKK